MKRLMVTSLVLLAGISGEVMAVNCADNQVKNSAITTAVYGKTVCATNGGDKWQEFHAPNFDLIDWKKGGTDPIDPTKKVGTWSTDTNGNNSAVNYHYGSRTYSYKVYLNNGQYTFCGVGGAPTLDVSLRDGQGPC